MRKTKAQAAQKEAQNEAKKVDQMEVEDDDFEYGVGYESYDCFSLALKASV